ncbi:flagellar basal body rod protein [Peribacillus cavernae]|uniref:Flagellar basal body rod protein n=1 Tax=Peribacillus cavernae TaxID=1674310 RepID=A0A433HTF0_9BACI|nr:flagellar basal body rod protein [Peribacillus cavernae]MDQ0218614.1 lia operon protein LiaI [Peribacillus cavernae]RUQ31598.1 flagellar basal body rod protein [Peribacillus cavernae]
MKKFGLLLAGGIAACVLLVNVGPMIGLAISLVILYFVFKQFMKTESTSRKIVWGLIGLAALAASVSNIPSIVGVAAAYVLYLVYKKWTESKKTVMKEEADPFVSFERQWADLERS